MQDRMFDESGYRFDFTASTSAVVADKPSYKGLSAVDFIIELSDEHLFVEVKNPDNKHARREAREAYLAELNLDKFPKQMATKCKDSLLKEFAKGKQYDRPVKYILLLQFAEFDAAQRRKLFERTANLVPNFAELEYSSVCGISFEIHNISEFRCAYSQFEVAEI